MKRCSSSQEFRRFVFTDGTPLLFHLDILEDLPTWLITRLSAIWSGAGPAGGTVFAGVEILFLIFFRPRLGYFAEHPPFLFARFIERSGVDLEVLGIAQRVAAPA